MLSEAIHIALCEKWMSLAAKWVERHSLKYGLAALRLEHLMPKLCMKIHKQPFFHCAFAVGITPAMIASLRRLGHLRDKGINWDIWASKASAKQLDMKVLLRAASRLSDIYPIQISRCMDYFISFVEVSSSV